MSEVEFDWNPNYDEPAGAEKIAARQLVYLLCLPEGVEPPDYEHIIIEGLQTHARIPDTATIVDIGCSYPNFSKRWRKSGHLGHLIGIDPNSSQFNGLPYWQPLKSNPTLAVLKSAESWIELEKSLKAEDGITLFEARADTVPLPDHFADAVTTVFSGYHAFRNPEALPQIKRILKTSETTHRAGIHADATSGRENKERMIDDESRIAKVLSIIMRQVILPPPPLQAGFTAEDTLEIFPQFYQHVYVKHIKQEIIFNLKREVILNAHRTYRDSYQPKSGHLSEKSRDKKYTDRHVIKEEIFERALEIVVGGQIDDAEEAGELVTDKVRRMVTFASDEEIDLPLGENEYQKVA